MCASGSWVSGTVIVHVVHLVQAFVALFSETPFLVQDFCPMIVLRVSGRLSVRRLSSTRCTSGWPCRATGDGRDGMA